MHRNFLGLRCGATDGDRTWRIWWVFNRIPIPYLHEIHLQIDHIVPWSWDHELAYEQTNLQILCCCCNARKGNRNDYDYRPGHYSWIRIWIIEPIWQAISRRRGWHDPRPANRGPAPH
jgi:5-methylcytosine-specific restriction endonuclease McrA